jgi:hypothetical protein
MTVERSSVKGDKDYEARKAAFRDKYEGGPERLQPDEWDEHGPSRLLGFLLAGLALLVWVVVTIVWGIAGFAIAGAVIGGLVLIGSDDGGTGPY